MSAQCPVQCLAAVDRGMCFPSAIWQSDRTETDKVLITCLTNTTVGGGNLSVEINQTCQSKKLRT